MGKTLRRALAAFLMVAVVIVATSSFASADVRPVERRMARLINRTREAHGLRALPLAGRPSRLARVHSAAMSTAGAVFHSCSICRYGENVGVADSVRAMHRTFMRSPIHRSNILSSRYDRIGIGIVRSGTWLWVTEMFLL